MKAPKGIMTITKIKNPSLAGLTRRTGLTKKVVAEIEKSFDSPMIALLDSYRKSGKNQIMCNRVTYIHCSDMASFEAECETKYKGGIWAHYTQIINA